MKCDKCGTDVERWDAYLHKGRHYCKGCMSTLRITVMNGKIDFDMKERRRYQ